MLKSLKVVLQDTAAEIGEQTLCGSFIDNLNHTITTFKEHDLSEGPETKGEKLIRFLLERSAKREQLRFIQNV